MESRNLSLVESLFVGNVAAFKKAFAESQSTDVLYEDLQVCNTKDDPIIFQMFYEKETVESIDVLSVAINFYYHFRHGHGGPQQNRLEIVKTLAAELPTDYFSKHACLVPYELSEDFECIPALVVAGLENDVNMIQALARFKIPTEEKCAAEKSLLYQILYYLPALEKEAQNALVQLLKDNAVHRMKDKAIITKVYAQLIKQINATDVANDLLYKATSEVQDLYLSLGLLELKKSDASRNTLFSSSKSLETDVTSGPVVREASLSLT